MDFSAPSNRMRTIHGISLAMGGKRVLYVMNRSKYKGAIVYHDIVGLLPPGTRMGDKRVDLYKRGVATCGEGGVRGLYKDGMDVIFRSPVLALGPAVPINGRVARTVVGGRGMSESRTGGETIRVLGLMKVPSTRRHCNLRPRFFSKKVHRHYILTVTLTYSPRVLFTSRTAATLSTAIRTGVLSLLLRLERGAKVDVIFVSRSLKTITEVTSEITIVCTKGVVRVKATRRICCSPQRPCA